MGTVKRLLLALAVVTTSTLALVGEAPAHAAIHTWPGNWGNPSAVSRYNNWGFNICGGEYVSGWAHLGTDSQGAAPGSPVKAIGTGTVKAVVSYATGRAVVIQHKSTRGDFVAVYGHVNPSIGVGARVAKGTALGTVTRWVASGGGDNSHLHFSVIPGAYRSGMHLGGYRDCASASGTLGYVDPIPYLSANGPASSTPVAHYSRSLAKRTPAGNTRNADITFSFTFRNPTSKAIVANTVNLALRDPKGKSLTHVFGTKVTFAAKAERTFTVTKRFSSLGKHRGWGAIRVGSKWYDSNVVEVDVWQPKIVSGRWYRMESRLNSGLRVDVAGARNVNGARVQLAKANQSVAQKWKFVATSAGYYKILSGVAGRSTGRGLDASGGGKTNGKKLQIWGVGGNGGANQQWKPVWTAGGGWVLIPRSAGGQRVDVPGGKAADGKQLQIWESNKSLAQRFNIWETGY